MKKLDIIGACSDLGVMIDGADESPNLLIGEIDKTKINNVYMVEKLPIEKDKTLNSKKRNLKYVNEFNKRLYNLILKIPLSNIPLTIGGDHSIAIASALASIDKYKDLGIIWFDSHTDFNTFDTTITGNIHGLPLAVISGYEKRYLSEFHNGKYYDYNNVVIVGARDMDILEKENLKDAGITIYTTEDIKKYGVRKVTENAIQILRKNVSGIHISYDIDLIDPNVAPGVSVKANNGITENEAYEIVDILINNKEIIKSIDLVEYNPICDVNDKTKKIALTILNKIINSYI